jgi:plasmid stability protein
MTSLTLKNMPDDLLESLRQRAREQRRSLNSEAIILLEKALAADAGQTHLKIFRKQCVMMAKIEDGSPGFHGNQ